MHPLLQSRSALMAYAAAWIPFGAAYAYLFALSGQLRLVEDLLITAEIVLALALVCLAPHYVCRSRPLGSHPIWQLALLHFLPAMFFSGIILASNHIFIVTLQRFFAGLESRFASMVPVLASVCLLTYLLSTALHYAFQAVQASQRAELLSREAQLTALKAQVNPHFLFNSLNSISALTSVHPGRAREMCIRLSDFLRTSLRLGERSSISFREELALAKIYLEVEQVRFGDGLRVVEEIDPECLDCEVPALVIQPLVENAVKHGIATMTGPGTVRIRAEYASGGLLVTIENEYDSDAPATSRSGFGIANVRHRLQARFGNDASLQVTAQNDCFQATLRTPCKNSGRSR